MKKLKIAYGVAGALVAAVAAVGLWNWHAEHLHVASLEKQVAALQKDEMRSAIVSSVSKQLGDIASDQQRIAEEKAEEAERQKQVADEERMRSEIAKREAQEAERQAKEEKQNAEEARHKADIERNNAMLSEQRATEAKRQADTLRYLALGHSLGASSLQMQSTNPEIAQLLAYYAYYYTEAYGGDMFTPAVFQALLNASHSWQTWKKHRGAVTGIDFMPQGDDRFVTVSTYGEMFIHKKVGNRLETKTILSSKDLDFRDLYVTKQGSIFALSRSGHFVYWRSEMAKPRIISLKKITYPLAFNALNDRYIQVIGERAMALIDLSKKDDEAVVGVNNLNFKVVSCGLHKGMSVLFDDQHHEYLVRDFNKIDPPKKILPMGTVSEYVYSASSDLRFYGMTDGSIYMYKSDSDIPVKMIGHKSRITKMKLYNYHLYTTSYDGKMNFWNTESDKTKTGKIEPMELLSMRAWILAFTSDNTGQYVWTGDHQGNLTEALLRVSNMKSYIETELRRKHRDFTEDEWTYYIGKNEPYRPVLFAKGKEVRR